MIDDLISTKRLISQVAILAFAILAENLYADITVQPYLQLPHEDSITVLWWTDTSAPASQVRYGREKIHLTTKATNTLVPSMGMWLHEATIEKLRPATTYRYIVASESFKSNEYTFTTAPNSDSDFKFAILGDGRTDNGAVIARHRLTATLAIKSGAAFIIELGDLVKSGSANHWNRFLRLIITQSDAVNPGSNVGSVIPFLSLVGNHEIYSGKFKYDAKKSSSMLRYKSVFANPTNGSANPAWEERYYSFDYGCATFIILDTNNDSNDEFDNHRYLADGATPDWAPGSEQYKWMIRQLKHAQKNKTFTFVLFHPSPFSRGVHGAPKNSQSGYQLRVLEPVFRKYGVDAIMTSHDHIVEHSLTGPNGFWKKSDISDPKNLNWFVIGNSGEASRSEAKDWKRWMSIKDDGKKPFFTRYFYSWAKKNDLTSFLLVNIKKDNDNTWQATFEIERSDGKRFDKTVIHRDAPIHQY
jgi:hypothetical protein